MTDAFIPIYQPYVSRNQKKYVNDCLDSNMLSFRGKYVPLVESKLAEYLGSSSFSTTFNGSVSLMTILAALGIGSGDEVITQTLTYAATVFSVLNVGATPVLVDSTNDYQMDIAEITKALTKKTKAVLVAQLYGNSPDLVELKKICDDNGVYLIEDSAECFGCTILDKNVGTFGIASSFSFFSNKLICSAGEGGGIATSDLDLLDRMNFIKSQAHSGGFVHKGPVGYNHRATNIQAAVLLAQLEDVEAIVVRKREIATYYRKFLHHKVNRIMPRNSLFSTEWMPLFRLPESVNYFRLKDELSKSKVDSRPCFTPVHLMAGFNRCRTIGKLSVSKEIYRSGFNLPCYPDLTDEQLQYIVSSVNKVIDDC